MVFHPEQANYPLSRPRRMRRDAFSRDLMRESSLSASDLIQPVFVREGEKETEAVPSMPGVFRMSIDVLVEKCRDYSRLGIPAVVLFPVIPTELKSLNAEEAWNPLSQHQNGEVRCTIQQQTDLLVSSVPSCEKTGQGSWCTRHIHKLHLPIRRPLSWRRSQH